MVCNVLVEKILILYHIGPSANLKLPDAPGSGKVFLMYNLVRPGPHVSSHRAAHISQASFVSGQRIRNQTKRILMAGQRHSVKPGSPLWQARVPLMSVHRHRVKPGSTVFLASVPHIKEQWLNVGKLKGSGNDQAPSLWPGK